jgi:hypothetical protein
MTIARPFEWFFGIGPNDCWIFGFNMHNPEYSEFYWWSISILAIWAIKENWSSFVDHFSTKNYLALCGLLLLFAFQYQILKVGIHFILLVIDSVDWTDWTTEEYY